MKTLYFIGNGFDIAHDIKSRYKAFRDFMNASKEYDDLVIMLEELYGCAVEDLWSEFETALGLITGETIYKDAVGNAGEDEEFPIAGPSFNKYFRNPDFCNEEKWTEAAKVLKAVRKDYMEGE